MSVGMSLLAILDEGPTYGLHLKKEFEARTGGVWPLNVGQVYTTLARMQRDGLVVGEDSTDPDSHKVYRLTTRGKEELEHWFYTPSTHGPPPREELVLKLVMTARRGKRAASSVIQGERKATVELLQEYTRLKREAPTDPDLGWLLLLDSLIFSAEARVHWLDACEARLSTAPVGSRATARSADSAIDAERVKS